MVFDRAGFDREVGLRLQRARRERGVTQEELAGRIGLPRASYANIESGRQRVPLDVVWRAAIVLEQPLGALVPEPLARAADSAQILPLGAPAAVTESLGFLGWRTAPEDAKS
jgi:transcriptional regulator with XRE-family HTH domain